MDFVPHFYLHGRMALFLLAAVATLWFARAGPFNLLQRPALKLLRS